MEEKRLRGLGFECISGEELQIRGGASWFGIARKIARALVAVAKFVDEYGEDMERGFKRGWDSV